MNLSVTVYGRPQPQGSTKAFVPKGWKRPIITSDNAKLKPWRQEVSGSARAAMGSMPPTPCAVSVEARFFFAKPKSTKACVTQKTTKPDIDKLERALLDSLTGIVFNDDAQVVRVTKEKLFGTPERVEFTVTHAETVL